MAREAEKFGRNLEKPFRAVARRRFVAAGAFDVMGLTRRNEGSNRMEKLVCNARLAMRRRAIYEVILLISYQRFRRWKRERQSQSLLMLMRLQN